MPDLQMPLVLGLLPWAAYTVRRALGLLHILQLEEYESTRYLRWLAADYRRVVPPGLPALLLVLAATLVVGMLGLLSLASAAAVAALGGVGALARYRMPLAKKPLVMTKKALAVLMLTAGLWLVLVGLFLAEIGELGLLVGVALA